MDLDQGGRQLAGLVLDAAGRGQHDQLADLIGPLDADQLRKLVTDLAGQADQTMLSAAATGPAAACELAINAAAPMFGTTPEAILSAERSRPVSDARAVRHDRSPRGRPVPAGDRRALQQGPRLGDPQARNIASDDAFTDFALPCRAVICGSLPSCRVGG